MNGKVALGAVSPTPVPAGVFISYSYDPEGHHLTGALLPALRERGCDVVSDHDLPQHNPSSLPAWMDDQIATRVVICVLTPGYLDAFAETVADGAHPRKGLRYELRAIRQRIYDHGGRYDCPVIPVLPHTVQLDLVPATFRALDICRFNPETGAGVEQLVARIATLEGTGGGPMATTERVPQPRGQRGLRQIVHDLDGDLPAEQAIGLVCECLRLTQDVDFPWELVLAFSRLEEVIKDHGQVCLLRELTNRCLRVLRSRSHLFAPERELESKLLICGVSWCLQRDHQLSEALEEARNGIRLAKWSGDPRTVALGKQSVGRIHRLLAEDASGQDRDSHLRASIASLDEAMTLFTAIDGNHARRSQAGVCFSLMARTQLSQYRLLGDEIALGQAGELAGRADELLASGQKKDRCDLTILRAEIAAENRKYRHSQRLLSKEIDSLVEETGNRDSEVLARAYQARATVAIMSGSARIDVLKDLKKARDIFQRQELAYAAASCGWTMVRTDPASGASLKLTRADVWQLEKLTIDPRVRLNAIAIWERESRTRSTGQKIDWPRLVERSRFE